MIGLLGSPDAMRAVVRSRPGSCCRALLAPIGYVLQDVVADAMTVEAVPRFDDEGRPTGMAERRSMHTTMQTLGRVAIIGGSVLVSLANVCLLHRGRRLPEAEKARVYLRIYQLALMIPLVSVLGVLLAGALKRRDARRLAARRASPGATCGGCSNPHGERPPVNWWILGGGLVFAAVSLGDRAR